jgi:uroporphyrinogen decarboxylase
MRSLPDLLAQGIPQWPWKPEPDCTRLLRTLARGGDPLRVPVLELFADPEIIFQALGEPMVSLDEQMRNRAAMEQMLDQRIAFWYLLGYDALWQGPEFSLPYTLRLTSEDTAEVAADRRRWVDETAGIITSWADFERYPWPDPASIDLYPMEYVARNLPEGMGMIAEVDGPLENVMWLMGYETFAYALFDQPDLVEALFSRMDEIYIPLARAVAQMDGVIAIWMGDDMGFKTSTMISPDHLRQYVLPHHKAVAAIAHEHGLPFLLHSCGNLELIMEDLIDDVGIDAKHSFEDVIEPVESFVARYADRLAVIGGVDVDLLASGSEAQVRARTRKILAACGPSRAYVLGTGNSVTNYIPLGNFLAMLDEGQRFNAGLP